MTDTLAPATYNVQITGEVSGQVAVGSNIVQIGQVAAGARVDIALPPAPPRRLPAPRLLLPRPFPNLLGRDAEVGAASRALLEAMPVELSGEAGVGKTVLLRHLARQLDAKAFPDGLVYLSGRGQVLGDLLQCLFEAFYASDQPHKASDAELRGSLQGIRALVLLDDVSLPRDQLESVLDLAPECTFLFADERPELVSDRRAIALGGLAPDAALRLIERELGRPLTEVETAAAGTLCTAVKGHPLRLLQAAARSRADGGALAAGEPPAPTDDRSRRVLGVLALVGAPLTAAQAATIAGVSDVQPVLDGLAERKLIRVEADRYTPAATGESLLSATEASATQARALEYFSSPPGKGGIETAEIAGSSEAIIQVLGRAAAASRWDDVLSVAHRVEGALALAPRWGAWDRVLAKAAEAAAAANKPNELAWSLHQSGTLALCVGKESAARAALTRALEIRVSLKDTAGAELTRHNLSLLVPPPLPPDRPEPSKGPGQPDGPAVHVAGWKPLATKLGVAALIGAAGWGVWRALAPGPPPATLPDALRFNPQDVGAISTMQTVSFFNRGGSVLERLRVATQGPQAAEFTVGPEKCSRARIASGQGCAIGVRFRPTGNGPRSATLGIFDQDGRTLASVPLAGTGSGTAAPKPPPPPTPRLVWVPSAVAFPETPTGETVTAAVGLSNRGAGQFQARGVRVQGPQSAEFRVVREDCTGRALRAAARCTIEVGFQPAEVGQRTARLTLAGDGGMAATVSLSGRGQRVVHPAAVARVDPERLDFGSQAVNAGAPPRTVTITNSGNAPLTLASIAVSGADQGSFAAGQACAVPVEPGGHCSIELRFTPRRAGDHSAALSLSFAGGLPAQQVALTGIGSAPVGPVARIDPAALDFGTQDLSGRKDAIAVRVTNGGSAPLTVGKISVEDDGTGNNDRRSFHQQNRCSRKTLAPNESCEISVQFTPSTVGAHAAALTIADNASGSPHRVGLTGTAEGGVLAVSPASLGFAGTPTGGRSEPQTVTVTNSGTRPMPISRIVVGAGGFAGIFGQGDATQFAIVSNDCGSALAPGASCAVGVSFTPQKPGDITGKLSVFGEGGTLPSVQADLAGSGMAVELPSPRPIGPGVADAAQAPDACLATTIVLSWTAVGGNGVGYLVRLEEQQFVPGTNQRTTPKVLIDEQTPTPDIRRDVRGLVAHNGSFSWSVRARDAAGNQSAPSPPLYFFCNIVG